MKNLKNIVTFDTSYSGGFTSPALRLAQFYWVAREYNEHNSSSTFREGKRSKVEVTIYQGFGTNTIKHSRGESFCSWKDKPNFNKGVNIALGRALKNAGIK